MKILKLGLIALILGMATSSTVARDRIRLETTIIKGNKEMPQIVYIVPWKDMKDHGQKEQTLVLHSLFGDLFEPVHADDIQMSKPGLTRLSDSHN